MVVSRSSTAALIRVDHLRLDREAGGRLQLQPGGEQALDHHVVQVAGDAFAVLEHHEQLPLLLRPGPLQGQRRLAGERGEQPHIGRRRTSAPPRRVGDGEQAEHGARRRQWHQHGRAGATVGQPAHLAQILDDDGTGAAQRVGQGGVPHRHDVPRSGWARRGRRRPPRRSPGRCPRRRAGQRPARRRPPPGPGGRPAAARRCAATSPSSRLVISAVASSQRWRGAGGAVQACVLDGDAGGGGQRDHDLLVATR